MTSMQAVTFSEFGAPDRAARHAWSIGRSLGPDDVLVRIHAAGICYHDVLSRGGKIPGGHPGRILGHEIAGEIVAGGANVGSERIGERVVVYQRLFCGACRYCLRGRQDLCRNSRVLGESGGGGYAEFTCVAGAQRDSDARRARHECGGARGLSGRDQRARGARRRQSRAGQRGPDHRCRWRARPASDPGCQKRECACDRGHELGGEGRDRASSWGRRGHRQPGPEVQRRGVASDRQAGSRRGARQRRHRHFR